jgi:hypothetical protein
MAPEEHSVFVGWAQWRHRLHVPLEEHVLVMAPPRTYKTAFLADVILRYPGPVISTTTKADVHGLTAAVRARFGPVHVFNPQHIGGVASTFRWSPVSGCEDPATAIRRADAFAFAVSHQGVEDGTFWSSKASDYLRGYFHAAALAGYDLRAVAAWVSGADPHVPEQILASYGARQWARPLVARPVMDGRLVSSDPRGNPMAVRADDVVEQVSAVNDLEAERFPGDWLAAAVQAVRASFPRSRFDLEQCTGDAPVDSGDMLDPAARHPVQVDAPPSRDGLADLLERPLAH